MIKAIVSSKAKKFSYAFAVMLTMAMVFVFAPQAVYADESGSPTVIISISNVFTGASGGGTFSGRIGSHNVFPGTRSGYTFSHWSTPIVSPSLDEGESVLPSPHANTPNISIHWNFNDSRTRHITLQANWTHIYDGGGHHTLTVRARGGGSNHVAIGGGSFGTYRSGQFRSGDRVTISARPARNYYFDRWTYSHGETSNDFRPEVTFIMPNRSVTVWAEFYHYRDWGWDRSPWGRDDRRWDWRWDDWRWDWRWDDPRWDWRFDDWRWDDARWDWRWQDPRWGWDHWGDWGWGHTRWQDPRWGWDPHWFDDPRWGGTRWYGHGDWRNVPPFGRSFSPFPPTVNPALPVPVASPPGIARAVVGSQQNDPATDSAVFTFTMPGLPDGYYTISIGGIPAGVSTPGYVRVNNQEVRLRISNISQALAGTHRLYLRLYGANQRAVTAPTLFTLTTSGTVTP